MTKGSILDAVVDESSLIDNTASSNGGAVYLLVSGGSIANARIGNGSLVLRNKAGGQGGGVYVEADSFGGLHTLGGARLEGNRASGEGGAVFAYSRSTSLASNLTIGGLGTLLAHNTAGAGGGAVSLDGYMSVRISDGAVLLNNTATSDGGGMRERVAELAVQQW